MPTAKSTCAPKARFSPRDLTLAQVLCAPPGVLQHRDRTVGRYQRRMRWIVNGNLIAPDWREVRS